MALVPAQNKGQLMERNNAPLVATEQALIKIPARQFFLSTSFLFLPSPLTTAKVRRQHSIRVIRLLADFA
jgi:hypothetical protein